MAKKEKWEIERDKKDALRTKGYKSLTKDQWNAIVQSHIAIGECLNNLYEMQDLYLSDVRKLDKFYWKLKHEFMLEDRRYG